MREEVAVYVLIAAETILVICGVIATVVVIRAINKIMNKGQ